MTMSKVNRIKALTAAFAVLFLMNSCTDFFSASWGDMFKRDPDKVRVTASNVYDLLNAAKGDPELSKAILNKINASSDPALKRAAIKAANQAVGVSTLALENVKALIKAADNNDPDALRSLAETIQGDLRKNGIVGVANKLTTILANEVGSSTALSSVALKNAGNVAVNVSKIGGGTGTITIDANANGIGTATISVNGAPGKPYSCTINDNGTITLIGAGENGGSAVIGYGLNANKRFVLSNLDAIKDPDAGLGQGLVGDSSPFEVPVDKPIFKPGFADNVSESDLTLLVMTLVLAKVEELTEENLDDYLNDWLNNKNVETGKGMNDDEKLVAATVNEMIRRGELTSDENELTKMLRDLLGVKRL
jgi:alanyl-tRNA synthetase